MDRAEFDAAFIESRPNLFRYVLDKVGDKWVAEDIVSRCYVNAAPHVERWEDRGKPVLYWLLVVARNAVIEHWRRAYVRYERTISDNGWSLLESGDASIEIDDYDPKRDRLQGVVRMAILRLPTDHQREAMLLFYVDGLSHRQVAEAIGVTEDASRHIVSRGLSNLRKMAELNEMRGL